MREADATDHDLDPEVLSGWGICGVFAMVSVGYLGVFVGICGYLRRGRSDFNNLMNMEKLAFCFSLCSGFGYQTAPPATSGTTRKT